MAMCDMDTGAVLGNNALQIDVLDSNNPFSYTSSGESLPFGFAGRFRDISGLHFNRGLGPRPINLGLGSANNVPTYVAVGVGVFVIAGAILAPEVVIPLLLSQPVVWGGVAYSAYAIGKQVYDVHNGDQDRIHYGTMALDAVGLIPLAGVVAKSVRAGWMGTRATGAGNNIFAGAQLHEYAPNGILIAQTCEDSCVRASSKMLLSDFGKNVPDYEIRAIIQEVSGGSLPMRDRGAFLNKVVELFEYAGVTNAQYQRTISFDDIYRMTQTNSIIAQVKGHAIVVDGVSGKLIKIRDPWSLTGTGQSYMIHADDFFSHGNVKAISFGGKQ